MRTLIRLVIATFVAGSLLTAGAAIPASAAACEQPAAPDADGRIRLVPGPWVGDGSYSGPTVSPGFALQPGQLVSFEARFENLKAKPRGIEVRAVLGDDGHEHFRLKAFVGDVNVSAAVFGDGYKFRGVQPDSSTPKLRFTATLKPNASAGVFATVGVVGNYGDIGAAGEPACGDAALFAVQAGT
jgi:hypothetical protein